VSVLYGLSCRTQAEKEIEMSEETQTAYKALDELLKAVSNLSVSYIGARPPLWQAYNKGVEVLDQAVKEKRYVLPSGQHQAEGLRGLSGGVPGEGAA
jgi:hypothetical protein